jgi:NADPH-dependent curcumin reductase CurA
LRALRKTCPAGIDVYFDNIGGETLSTVFRLMNVGARIPLIGMISLYNATELVAGPNLSPLLVKRAMIKGMIVGDHADREPDFLRDVSQWLREGKMRCRETIVEGLEKAPKAFIGLFHGENIGKLLVKV